MSLASSKMKRPFSLYKSTLEKHEIKITCKLDWNTLWFSLTSTGLVVFQNEKKYDLNGIEFVKLGLLGH